MAMFLDNETIYQLESSGHVKVTVELNAGNH
jgi:hypothetical protein